MDRWPATVERIGARFDERDEAVETMLELRRRFDLGASEVEVRDLGSTTYEQPPSGTLLAGQFRAPLVDQVVDVIRQHGGSIVERRSEPDPTGTPETSAGVSVLAPPPSKEQQGQAGLRRSRR
jgi:hypothetical protein